MLRDGRVWPNLKQMAELFAVTKMNISLHIANNLKEKELDDSIGKFSLQLPQMAIDTRHLLRFADEHCQG